MRSEAVKAAPWAVLAGALVAVQSKMNGQLAVTTGLPLEAAAYSFGSGLVVMTVIALLWRPIRVGLYELWRALRGGDIAWWQCVGGALGACFVITQAALVPVIGLALFTVATVAGQIGNALVVDRFGIGPAGRIPVAPGRLVAAGLALVGVLVAVAPHLGGSMNPVVVLLSVLVGGGIAIQQGLNGRVSARSDNAMSTAWVNFATGTALLGLCVLVVLLRGGEPARLSGAPWWAYLGGVVGLGFIGIAAWAVHHLGVLGIGLAMLSGQLLCALLLDLVAPSSTSLVSGWTVLGVLITLAAGAAAARAAMKRRAALSGVDDTVH